MFYRLQSCCSTLLSNHLSQTPLQTETFWLQGTFLVLSQGYIIPCHLKCIPTASKKKRNANLTCNRWEKMHYIRQGRLISIVSDKLGADIWTISSHLQLLWIGEIRLIISANGIPPPQMAYTIPASVRL